MWKFALRIAAGLALAGCEGSQSPPAELFQLWHNPNPAYADRSFELRPDVVIFGTGPGSQTVHEIASISSSQEFDEESYTLEYLAEGGRRVPLEIRYRPGPMPELQLGASPELWRPAGSDGASR